MKTELENIDYINELIKEASKYNGEWTQSHQNRINEIYTLIRFLSFNTGKKYVIDSANAKLVVEE